MTVSGGGARSTVTVSGGGARSTVTVSGGGARSTVTVSGGGARSTQVKVSCPLILRYPVLLAVTYGPRTGGYAGMQYSSRVGVFNCISATVGCVVWSWQGSCCLCCRCFTQTTHLRDLQRP